jgi:hypothetical protein
MNGLRFGRLVIMERLGIVNKQRHVSCLCDCGTVKSVALPSLKNGLTKSCGCFRRETSRARGGMSRTHGHSGGGKSTRVYRAWAGMLTRCLTPTNRAFPNYGGRGITVCERWMTFENFLNDMGEPGPGESLDRIDNDLLVDSYSKANCRWATTRIQGRNRRSTRLNADLVSEIRRRREHGESLRLIADRMSIPVSCVNNVVYMRAWKDVP